LHEEILFYVIVTIYAEVLYEVRLQNMNNGRKKRDTIEKDRKGDK